MEQTNKPQDWRMAPATASTDLAAVYGDKFAAALETKIDAEGHTFNDCTKSWMASEDGVKITLMLEEVQTTLTYEVKYGARSQRSIIDGVVYDWISVPKMKEGIEQHFDDNGAPLPSVWAFCKNKPTSKKVSDEPQNVSTTPTHASRTAPRRKAEQTTSTPVDVPSISSRATQYFLDTKDGRKYSVTPDGQGDCEVVSINARGTDIKHHVLELQRVMQMLKQAGCIEITAEEFEGTLNHQDAEIAAAARDIAAHAKEVAEQKPEPKPEPATAPEETTHVAENAQPKNQVVPLNLPDTILTTDLKDGRMTISGLTDLTAEQVQIFIAGMNAMREAIRKQMKMTADGQVAEDNLQF